MLYDGPVRMRGVTFANFDRDGSSAVSGAASAGVVVSGRFSVENSRFVDARPVLMSGTTASDGERMARLLDVDGSATGIAGATIVPSHDFLLGDDCSARPDWHAHVCRGGVTGIFLEGEGSVAPAIVRRDDGVEERYGGYQPTSLYLSVRTGRDYIIRPESGSRSNFNLYADGLAAREELSIAVPVTTSAYRALDIETRERIPVVESMEALERMDRTAVFFDRAAGLARVRFVGEGGRERPGIYVYGD
jgi:hypothetical protein